MICSQMKDCAAFFVLNLRIRAGVEQQINDRPFALFDCQVEGCLAFKGFPCVNFLTSRYPDLRPHRLNAPDAPHGVSEKRPASMGDVKSARSSDEMRCFEPGVDVATIVLSHVDGVETRVALASVSRTWRNAARLPESRPARYDSTLLRVLRESCPALKAEWPESQAPEEWGGVRMEDDRVVGLDFSLSPRPLLAVPAVIGQFTSLRCWTSAQSADKLAGGDRAAHVAEVLTSTAIS